MEELEIKFIFSYPFIVCEVSPTVQLVYVTSIDSH